MHGMCVLNAQMPERAGGGRLRGLERMLPEDGAAAAMAELGSCAAEVVLASMEAATKLQDMLLNSSTFGLGAGDGAPTPPSNRETFAL